MAKKSGSRKKATKEKASSAGGGGKKKKAGPEPASRGLEPAEVLGASQPQAVTHLRERIEADGGAVVAAYRDPLGGQWQVLAALPIARVEPTPFQRDRSATHVQRLGEAIDALDRYLDPLIAVRTEEGSYWTPNGAHRLAALEALGARSVTALVLPEVSMAFRILALNTEKAHNLKEKATEVIRMARALADMDPEQLEERYQVEFEEPALLTLGAAYQQKGRFAGSAYHPVLKKVEGFLSRPLPEALETRERRAGLLLEVDAAVDEAVAALKERGFQSSYLKSFVVARVRPRDTSGGFDAVLEAMRAAAAAFDPDSVDPGQVGG